MQNQVVYVAFSEYQKELLSELKSVNSINDNLIFSSEKKLDVCFAADIWLNPQITNFTSINNAAQLLKSQHKTWFLYPLTHIRRSKLIAENLITPFKQILSFPPKQIIPTPAVFCLLDNNTLLYSTQRWKKFPVNVLQFQEDKINPPNRAYLKLWEAFSFLNQYPKPGEIALDLGAAPGGWSYVLNSFGANVIAVDKAPLALNLMQQKNIDYRQQSAFALNPQEFNHIDWLCADIACYPERLYQFINRWLDSGKVKNFICTIKLQGATDFKILRKFQQLPNALVTHLYYNKHEVCFMCPVSRESFPHFKSDN